MLTAYARKIGAKLLSALVFTALALAWLSVLSFIFKATGLRARFHGADDFGIAVMTIGLIILMVPVPIAHGRIMKRIHM